MAVERSERTRPFRRRRRRSEGLDVSATVSALPNAPFGAELDASTPWAEARERAHTFDELFELHYERLVRALTVVAGDRELAADAVQDAFVKAHLHWSRIARYDDPVGWIRRVAINRLRDERRRDRRKLRAVQLLGRRSPVADEPPEIDEFDRLLAALPRQQRLTTALYYVERLTVAEIAETLELSDGTVKSHLHDARRRLRPILEADDD